MTGLYCNPRFRIGRGRCNNSEAGEKKGGMLSIIAGENPPEAVFWEVTDISQAGTLILPATRLPGGYDSQVPSPRPTYPEMA